MNCLKRESEEANGPPTKILKSCGDDDWFKVQENVEICMNNKCLCPIEFDDLVAHLAPLKEQTSDESQNEKKLLNVNFLTWAGSCFHSDLSSGMVCSNIQMLVNHVMTRTLYLDALLQLTKDGDAYLKFCSYQAIATLLPLSFCGQDTSLPASQVFIQNVIKELKFASTGSSSCTKLLGRSSLSVVPESCHVILPGLDQYIVSSQDSEENVASSLGLSDEELEQQSWLLKILHDFLSHGGKDKDDTSTESDLNESCNMSELEDEMLCQEVQVKCFLMKQLEPVWENVASTLADVTSTLDTTSEQSQNGRLIYTIEGYRLWRDLTSVRANVNFVETKSFSSNLSLPVHQLQKKTPSLVWREVLDTLTECLCYGSTLGLQSIPPEEPCQLAHTIIRLVRFDGFLNRVPHSYSRPFVGGGGGDDNIETDDHAEQESSDQHKHDHDKALLQKIILLILKSVALTTREARVDSSSGESDSSLSSHESASSCNSDLVIIERNMNGVYKQLDKWIKSVLPILPDTSLQENILNILQEQDDVLIEGLLCLLDTHIALQHPSRDQVQVSGDCCPTEAFIKFISIVGEDSSVLLDFLVSNETCFLLYLLRYLKFIIKDWNKFVTSCGSRFSSTLAVILNLRSSIQRLLSKDLFPYNISPVYKLLEKVQQQADLQK